MKRIGAHVSASGGVENAPLNASAIGARAFALFTKNQRQWVAGPLTASSINAFKKNLADSAISVNHVLPHDGYLINLGNPDHDAWQKSFDSFVDELSRCHALGLKYLNSHPGSSLKKISDEECLRQIAQSINKAHKKVPAVMVLLENTAGQGSNVGWRFEHLAAIIAQVDDKARVGVCIDTCHTFAAGYDLKTRVAYDRTMAELDDIIGISYVKGMHLNDSKGALGSRKDRHDSLGKGQIGLEAFGFIMNDRRFDEIPLILETIDDTVWKEEIELLYGMVGR